MNDRFGPSAIFEWYRDDWLVSRRALKLFLISTIFVLATIPVFSGRINPGQHSVLLEIFWGIEGVVGTLSIFFLWLGMWRYWVRLDSSSGVLKATSFFLLLFGVWFGAVPYCFFVYRPQVLRRSWAVPPPEDWREDETPPWRNRKGLAILVAVVVSIAIVPKLMEVFGAKDYVDDVWTGLTFLLGLGLVCLLVYPFVQLYRCGMRRRP